MFTGIIEELGRVVERQGSRLRLGCQTTLADIAMGASIAVNGCCLTVVEWDDSGWVADVTDETYARTALGGLEPGDSVNLERPVRLLDRLGGHLVQGHVDGVGIVVEPAPALRVALPAGEGLGRYVVEKGSIAVDGVSLTVVEANADDFTAAIIPHTAAVTTLGHRPAGSQVNLEVDITAKHIERLLAWKEA